VHNSRYPGFQPWILLSVGLALIGSPHALLADTPTAPPTAQQTYNEAQAAYDKSDWPTAIKGFASIARPDEGGEVSHAQGIIRARLAQAYAHERQPEEAVPSRVLDHMTVSSAR